MNSNNNAENFEIERNYHTAFNKSKKSLKRSPNRPDLLLYDTDTTDHIINDRKWFKDDYTPNKDQLKTLKTKEGPVIPKDSGTTVFTVVSQINPLKYREIMFEDTLYLLDININLFSGLKHYKSKGYFKKNKLYIS